jgi:hypothetical protein
MEETGLEKIILYKGQSQYDVLRDFIDDLADAFEHYGYRPVIIDLLDEKWIQDIETTLNEGNVLFALGMNCIGMEIKTGSTPLYDALNIPYFGYLVDHPFYHMERLKLNKNVKNALLSCVDRAHVSYLKQFVGPDWTASFIPHGASFVLNDPVPFENKRIEILFTGTCMDPDRIRNEWTTSHSFIRAFCDELAELGLARRDLSLIECLDIVLSNKGLEHNKQMVKNMWPALREVDKYIRGRRRMEVITTLSNVVPIHIYGNGWDGIKNNKNLHIHAGITFEEIKIKMQNSKMVLTVLPNFTDGGHERIFTSALAGAVNLTDRNLFLSSHFKHLDDIVFYDSDLNSDFKGLDILLQDNESLQKIADAARKKVLEHHLWRHRAARILDAVYFHKWLYNNGN